MVDTSIILRKNVRSELREQGYEVTPENIEYVMKILVNGDTTVKTIINENQSELTKSK